MSANPDRDRMLAERAWLDAQDHTVECKLNHLGPHDFFDAMQEMSTAQHSKLCYLILKRDPAAIGEHVLEILRAYLRSEAEGKYPFSSWEG